MCCYALNAQNSEEIEIIGPTSITSPCKIYEYSLYLSGLSQNTNYTIYIAEKLESEFVDLTGWTFTSSLPNSQGIGYFKTFNTGNHTAVSFPLNFKMREYFSNDLGITVVGTEKGISIVSCLKEGSNIVVDWSDGEKILSWTYGLVYVIPANYTVSQAFDEEILNEEEVQSCVFKNLYLKGDFTIDVPFCFGTSYKKTYLTQSTIFTEDGAKIIVNPGVTLNLEGGIYTNACSNVWHGFVVQPGGKMITRIDDESSTIRPTIKNALNGIEATGNANQKVSLTLKDAIFVNNYVSLNINPSNLTVSNVFVRDMINCNINCSGNYALLPTGSLNVPSFYNTIQPYAGILIKNNMPVLIMGEGNVLEHLQNGVVLLNSSALISNTKFKNITGQFADDLSPFTGNAIYAKSIIEGKQLQVKGDNQDNTKEFESCDIGIRIHNVNSYINKLRMFGINNLGISIESCFGKEVEINNNKINSNQQAMRFFNNSYSRINVYSNTAESNPSSTSSVSVIDALSNDGLGWNLDFHDNLVKATNSKSGIRMVDNVNIKVRENTVELNANIDNIGIYAMGGLVNPITCNNVYRTGSFGNTNNSGIFMNMTNAHILRCNEVDNTSRGIEYMGMCDGDYIQGNHLNDHYYGLYYHNPTVTSQQPWYGNLWENVNNYSGKGAINFTENPDFEKKSRYLFDDASNAKFGTSVQSVNNEWFVKESNSEFFSCSNNYSCDGNAGQYLVPNIDSTFIDITNGTLQPDGANGIQTFILKTHAFKTILNFPTETQNFPAVGTFYTQEYSTNLGKFARIENGYRKTGASLVSKLDSISLENQNNNFWLDSLAMLASNSNYDSTLLANISQNIMLSESKLGDLLATPIANRNSLMNTLNAYNTGITTSGSWQVNQKAVNTVIYKVKNQGIASLDSTDFAIIETIANGCPMADGESVIQARALYYCVNSLFNDDRLSCHVESRSNNDSNNQEYSEIKVYPNPVMNELKIQGIDNIESYNAQINNVYGTLIMSKSAIVNDVINVSELPAGVYIISLQSEDNKLGHQIKFIKQQ